MWWGINMMNDNFQRGQIIFTYMWRGKLYCLLSCRFYHLSVSVSFSCHPFLSWGEKTYHRKTELSDLFSIMLYITAIIPSHVLATPGACSQTWFVWHLGLNKYSRATISLRYSHLPMLNKTNMAPPFLNNISTYLDCKFTWIFSWWQTTWNCLHYLCLWGWFEIRVVPQLFPRV